MDDISKLLAALDPMIEKIMGIAGTPGLSLGVLHKGKTVFFGNYGLRNVASKLPPAEETIYPGYSLTKTLLCLLRLPELWWRRESLSGIRE